MLRLPSPKSPCRYRGYLKLMLGMIASHSIAWSVTTFVRLNEMK